MNRQELQEDDQEGISQMSHEGIIMAAVVISMQIPIYNKLLLPVYAFGVIIYLAMLRLLKSVRQENVGLIRSYLGGRLAFVASVLEMLLLGSRKGRPVDLVK